MAAVNTEYDIVQAIKAIEDELIASMIANLDHHRAEEEKEGYQWSQWQAVQLQALDEYKKRNHKKYTKIFDNINSKIDGLIRLQRQAGNAAQEVAILNAIKKGAKIRKTSKSIALAGEFFKINDRKLRALIRATTDDMKKGETAIFRRANDQYRKIIYNAQIYAASGATYEKAVDMATKDFLRSGINCIEYSNGARHTLSEYTDMALRTAQKRAYLTGEGEKRIEWGLHLVILNKRGDNPCPKCLPFVGKILIDDIWSGGTEEDGDYPLMSRAVAAGLYHPNCRDSHTTYFPGISTPPDDKFTRAELREIEDNAKEEAKEKYYNRQAETCERMAKYSLDKDNKRIYQERANEWEEKALVNTNRNDIMESKAISGARNPTGDAAKLHAKKYYNLVRSMKTDVSKIARNTGYSEEVIQEIKEFVFLSKHDLGGSELEYFEPDYMMAESWRRLITGEIEPHDLILLEHEIMEKELMKEGYSQEEAHKITSKKYNYGEEATKYYDSIKKYKKEE